MDEKVPNPIKAQPDAIEYPQCPDCGEEFRPGHLCKESMAAEIMKMRGAFEVSVTAIYKIRNATIVWRRGKEEEKIKEVSNIARKAIRDMEELLQSVVPEKSPNEPH